jgi:predicted dehydrogenase
MATGGPDPVRIGVVGAGSIALRGILPHLTQPDVADRVVVSAVCDPVPGRARAAAERFGVPRAFETLEDLLAHGEVDAVSIASPIGIHYEQARLALAAGKHIHFNKTMTTTVAEATELIDAARARGLRLVASPGQGLRPQVQAIRRLIADGAIGTLCWAHTGAAFGTYHEREQVRQGEDVLSNIDPSWYYRRPGGGPLYDMTVYGLHELTAVLGPAKRVTAMSAVRIREREFRGRMVPCDADDNTLILLDYGGGLFVFVYGTPAGGIGPTTYFGTRGTIAGTRPRRERARRPGRRLGAPARDRPAPRHAGGPRLRGHHAAGRLDPRRHPHTRDGGARAPRGRHHRVGLSLGGDGHGAGAADHVRVGGQMWRHPRGAGPRRAPPAAPAPPGCVRVARRAAPRAAAADVAGAAHPRRASPAGPASPGCAAQARVEGTPCCGSA